MSLVALEILLQQVSRIALQIGITVRITGRLSVHSIVHAIEAQVHLSLTGIQSNQGIGRSMGIYSCRNTAVISLFPVLLQYDIENAGATARGIVFGRRVGHDLYALDRIRGDLVQGQGRWPAVYKDRRRRSAEGDVPIDVHVDARYITHDIL